jgi:hypothetical protein
MTDEAPRKRSPSGTWDVRQLSEVERMWEHIKTVEKEMEQMENAVSGMRYALFGLDEVPNSGLVHRIESIRREVKGVRRSISGLIATVSVALIIQIVLHYV